MHVGFEINGPAAVRRIIVDTVGDGEPGWGFTLDAAEGGRADGRAFRGFNVKPVIEGVWPLVVRVVDDRGCVAETGGTERVTVVR